MDNDSCVMSVDNLTALTSSIKLGYLINVETSRSGLYLFINNCILPKLTELRAPDANAIV